MTVTPSTHWSRDHRPMVRTVANVSTDLGVLENYSAAVGLPAATYPFPQVRAMVDRAQAWDRLSWEGRGQAEQAVTAARDRALAADQADMDAFRAYVEALDRARPWFDDPISADQSQPRPSLAAAGARILAQSERWRAGTLLNGATAPLYSRFAQVAAQAVEQVAALPTISGDAWSALEPISVLPAEFLAVLQASERTFNTCHAAGLFLRAMGLQGADVLQGDEPMLALTFRRWAEAAAHLHGLRTVKAPLKLAYAIDHGWQPGLWTRDDLAGVDQGPARRKYVPAFKVW